MKTFLVSLLLLSTSFVDGDMMVWKTEYGTVGLPFQATEGLIGYDGILKQSIAGASLPIYTDPKNVLALQVGAIAPWPNESGSTVEPYIGFGHDLARELPVLSEYKSLHLNIFGRYASTQGGRFGAGISVSYSLF